MTSTDTSTEILPARPVREMQYMARDLDKLNDQPIVVQIDGKWREVFDVVDDFEVLRGHFLSAGSTAEEDELREYITRLYSKTAAEQLVSKLAGDNRLYVAVRYLVEEKSTDVDIEDNWHVFRAVEPVSVLRSHE